MTTGIGLVIAIVLLSFGIILVIRSKRKIAMTYRKKARRPAYINFAVGMAVIIGALISIVAIIL